MDTIEQATAPAEQSPVETPQVETPEPQAEALSEPVSRQDALAKAFESLDADSAPADSEPKPKADGPARAADGKFIAQDATEKAPEPAKPAEGEQKPQQAEQAAAAPHDEAPSRFSPDAKAAWKDAPQPIRAEITRAVSEMQQGISEYKAKIEPLQPFYQLAEQSGTKLEDVLGRYVNLENTLRQDPVQGLSLLAQNMGATPQQLAQLLSGQPTQADPRDQQIHELRGQLAQLQQGQTDLQQTATQQRERDVASQIDQFKASHPRFDELSAPIAKMLNTGYAADLAEAYEMAERLHPAPAPEPQPAPQAQPAQTRPALSVTGAPSAGSNPVGQPSKTRSEALSRAMSAAGL